MIRHIVFFTARSADDRDRVFEGLSILRDIPDALHLEIGRNSALDDLTNEVPDFVVYGEFPDEAALARYKAHPLYQEAIRRVRPLRDMRIAADIESAVASQPQGVRPAR